MIHFSFETLNLLDEKESCEERKSASFPCMTTMRNRTMGMEIVSIGHQPQRNAVSLLLHYGGR